MNIVVIVLDDHGGKYSRWSIIHTHRCVVVVRKRRNQLCFALQPPDVAHTFKKMQKREKASNVYLQDYRIAQMSWEYHNKSFMLMSMLFPLFPLSPIWTLAYRTIVLEGQSWNKNKFWKQTIKHEGKLTICLVCREARYTSMETQIKANIEVVAKMIQGK